MTADSATASGFSVLEYPALFVTADAVSRRGQSRYVLLNRLELMFLIGAALLGAVISVTGGAGTRSAAAISVAFLIAAAVVRSVARTTSPSKGWFDGRAVAESVKTLTWKYVTRTDPFNGATAAADTLFLDALRDVLGERLLAAPDRRLSTTMHQITPTMRQARSLPFIQRKSVYVRLRLDDQLEWYTSRAHDHKRSNDRWFVAGIVFEILALAAGLLLIVVPSAPNLIGLLSTVTAASITFSRLRADSEVAQRYVLAAEEISVVRERLPHATEKTFPDCVREAEAAISREHKMWAAKRG